MTYLEKYKLEKMEFSDKDDTYIISVECPKTVFDNANIPDYCTKGAYFQDCERCWNREVPEICHYCNVEDDDYYGDIYQDDKTGEWYLNHQTCEWDDWDDDFVYDKIYIKYCPWCGRKL